MSILRLNDLTGVTTLDGEAMGEVRGGWLWLAVPVAVGLGYAAYKVLVDDDEVESSDPVAPAVPATPATAPSYGRAIQLRTERTQRDLNRLNR